VTSDERSPGSTQRELLDRTKSLRSKYAALFVGKKGIWAMLKYEIVALFVTPVPGALGFALRQVFYRTLLGKVGRGVVFGRNLTLRHPHKIEIGDDTFIDDNAVLDAKGEGNAGIRIGSSVFVGRNTILTCKEGAISLEDYCNVSANCHLLSETEIRVGKYSFLAGECYLVAGGNHPVADTTKPIMFQPSAAKGGIRIGEDCWLGARVTVLDGVTIGRGSIVGAGAVVASSLPEYTFALGDRRLRLQDRRSLAD
jgi:acetyltransferase-like isoleucine patch superfamily enzyme